MKSLRVWLLVLLAVLLPLRGALAAALMCPVAGTGVQAEIRLADPGHGHEHSHDAMHDGAVQQHAHADGSDGHHDHAGSGNAVDRCNVCSAFCSVTGVVGAPFALSEPPHAAIHFPHPLAAPPDFVPDGQERPPRSI